jgi:CopG family nickel-responsive transcriptional regulator
VQQLQLVTTTALLPPLHEQDGAPISTSGQEAAA